MGLKHTPRPGQVLFVIGVVFILLTAAILTWVALNRPRHPVSHALPEAPSIVLVLTDDFSMDLLAAMSQDDVMARRGASYANAFVDDSLCCVSRASIFTGQYPHQTGVLTNLTAVGTDQIVGGWPAFVAGGNNDRSFAVQLQHAGYATGFIGKYLNAYEPDRVTSALPPTPPGWTDFQAFFGDAYDEWEYSSTRTEGGLVYLEEIPAPPWDSSIVAKDRVYAGTDMERRAVEFIREHRDNDQPYFLEVATYAPHSRVAGTPPWAAEGHDEPLFPAAFRDRPAPGRPFGNCGPISCRDLTVADLPGWGDDRSDNVPTYLNGTAAPPWRINRVTLSAADAETNLRDRARMVQSIDRMLDRVLRAVDQDTYVIFTSDNGLHLGQHGLQISKGTPYDSDIHIPFLVVGPDVTPGIREEVISTIDIAPTLEELAGLDSARFRSGTSLVPTFASSDVDRRDYAFIEHTRSSNTATDPDQLNSDDPLGIIPSHVAVRSRTALLARFDLDPTWQGTDYVYEYYDLRDVTWEQTNTFAHPAHPAELRQMMRLLTRYDRCAAYAGDDSVPDACRLLTWA